MQGSRYAPHLLLTISTFDSTLLRERHRAFNVQSPAQQKAAIALTSRPAEVSLYHTIRLILQIGGYKTIACWRLIEVQRTVCRAAE